MNKKQKLDPARDKEIEEEGYFGSYADLQVHETMLRDVARTNAYRNAVISNKSSFENKVVLDVGGGTGILSIFAAKDGGAKKVYCVDASDVANYAKKVIESNGLSDKILVIHSKIEEVELPEKVDIIISEWMGYFLVFESMLDSVIVARDKWLKEGGLIFPNIAKMYVSPFCLHDLPEDRSLFWLEIKKLYDVDMTVLKSIAQKQILKEGSVEIMEPESILCREHMMKEIDISSIKLDDLKKLDCKFECSSMMKGRVYGLCSWFDVEFPHSPNQKKIVLSTSPFAEPTHWKQTSFFIKDQFDIEQDDIISGELEITKNARFTRTTQVKVIIKSNRFPSNIIEQDFAVSNVPSLDS